MDGTIGLIDLASEFRVAGVKISEEGGRQASLSDEVLRHVADSRFGSKDIVGAEAVHLVNFMYGGLYYKSRH